MQKLSERWIASQDDADTSSTQTHSTERTDTATHVGSQVGSTYVTATCLPSLDVGLARPCHVGPLADFLSNRFEQVVQSMKMAWMAWKVA